MSKKKKRKHSGPHYFFEPDSYRVVNCKRVPGERARKNCRKWNSFVKKRAKLKQQGRFEEMKQLEAEYHGIESTSETTENKNEWLEEEVNCIYDGYSGEFYYL